MLRAYKYRLYPKEEQKVQIEKTFGCVRFVYNKLLDARIKAYKRREESLNYNKCNTLLNNLKKGFPWLKEVNSQSLQMANRNLDTAYKNFFKNKRRYPNFKKKSNKQSFACPQNVKVDYTTQTLYLPKIGFVPCVFHRRFRGLIKTVTVSKMPSGVYYVSILVDTKLNEERRERVVNSLDDVIGIDMGITTLAVCSDNTEYENPKNLKKAEKALKKAQKEVSRKKKGSNNRKKAVKKLAKRHETIANKRHDSIEKSTYAIACKNQAAVAVEDLNTKGMMKNHKLAKAISDASFGFFLTRLENKCQRNGIHFVKVGRFFASSQRCNVCGTINKEIKDLKIREWTCPECSTLHNRDSNAAKNIQKEGYRLLIVPMDGGEFTPMETGNVDDRAFAPKKHPVIEVGRVLVNTTQEAPCL